MSGAGAERVDVVALAEERRRLQGWLRALERERDATPAHIYERVHQDYTTRLERVSARLSEHEGSLREEAASLESRLSLLDGEFQLRSDRRAELGLRANVGEIPTPERDAALAGLDQEIQGLATEREQLRQRLDRVRDLLAPEPSAARPLITPPPQTPTPPPPPPPTQPSPPAAAPPPPPAPAASATPAARAPAPARVSQPHEPAREPARETVAKTLKCAECGSMNYPTEWYCERCGAELSAL